MMQSRDTEKRLLIRGWFSFWPNSRSRTWRYLSLESGYFQMFVPRFDKNPFFILTFVNKWKILRSIHKQWNNGAYSSEIC